MRIERGDEQMIGKLIKYLIYLIIIAIIGVISYAYIGPYFGVDFSAQQSEVRKPVVLNAD